MPLAEFGLSQYVIEEIFSYLSRQDLLENCRRVSRRWRDFVDFYTRSRFYTAKQYPSEVRSKWISSTKGRCLMLEAECIDTLEQTCICGSIAHTVDDDEVVLFTTSSGCAFPSCMYILDKKAGWLRTRVPVTAFVDGEHGSMRHLIVPNFFLLGKFMVGFYHHDIMHGPCRPMVGVSNKLTGELVESCVLQDLYVGSSDQLQLSSAIGYLSSSNHVVINYIHRKVALVHIDEESGRLTLAHTVDFPGGIFSISCNGEDLAVMMDHGLRINFYRVDFDDKLRPRLLYDEFGMVKLPVPFTLMRNEKVVQALTTENVLVVQFTMRKCCLVWDLSDQSRFYVVNVVQIAPLDIHCQFVKISSPTPNRLLIQNNQREVYWISIDDLLDSSRDEDLRSKARFFTTINAQFRLWIVAFGDDSMLLMTQHNQVIKSLAHKRVICLRPSIKSLPVAAKSIKINDPNQYELVDFLCTPKTIEGKLVDRGDKATIVAQIQMRSKSKPGPKSS